MPKSKTLETDFFERGTFFYLIRHGKYEMDKNHLNYGHLVQQGHEQLRLTGVRLSTANFDHAISSTLERAQESAQIACSQLTTNFEIELSDDLIEGLPCNTLDLFQKFPKVLVQKDKARMDRAFRKFMKFNGNKKILIFAHGNLIRYFVCKALKLDPRLWTRFHILQGSLSTLQLTPQRKWRLVNFNDCGHIPFDLQSDF